MYSLFQGYTIVWCMTVQSVLLLSFMFVWLSVEISSAFIFDFIYFSLFCFFLNKLKVSLFYPNNFLILLIFSIVFIFYTFIISVLIFVSFLLLTLDLICSLWWKVKLFIQYSSFFLM